VIYILQIFAAIKLRRRLKEKNDPVAYQGILYIGLSGVFLVATFVSFVLQNVAQVDPDFYSMVLIIGESSIFITLGWIFAGLTTYCLYIGYIIPEWIRKRWAQKTLK
jgi:predicted MFS family arabinose efflux permease